MKTMPITIVVAMCVVLRAAAGQGHPDGLYLVGQPSAPVCRTQDGVEIRLGPLSARVVSASSLVARDNANTLFALQLEFPYDAELELGPAHVLVMGGVAHRQCGAGSSLNVSSTLNLEVQGREMADLVAVHYRIAPTLRRHPRHALRVGFVATRPSFALGAGVTVALRITNLGASPIAFVRGGRNRAARDNQYAFVANRTGTPVPDIGSSAHMGGLAGRQVIEAGATFVAEIDLGKWFAFDAVGTYELVGTYALEFLDPDTNEWQAIWSDVVAAEFVVRIEAAK